MLNNPVLDTSKRVILVTNAPAPYRIPAYELLAKHTDISLTIVYCTHSHIQNLTEQKSENCYRTCYLTKPYFAFKRSFLHSDMSVIKLLNEIKPDVVITTGYIPTFLYAFMWAWWRGVPHIVMTDGTLNSESNYSFLHKLIRKFVFRHSASFIGACQGSLALFKSYGVSKEKLFEAPLAINNQRFFNQKNVEEKRRRISGY